MGLYDISSVLLSFSLSLARIFLIRSSFFWIWTISFVIHSIALTLCPSGFLISKTLAHCHLFAPLAFAPFNRDSHEPDFHPSIEWRIFVLVIVIVVVAACFVVVFVYFLFLLIVSHKQHWRRKIVSPDIFNACRCLEESSYDLNCYALEMVIGVTWA